ncbi:MAG TPA: serine--tRNA ligase [Nitrososphaera sp.]|jgi:seryl-tRNA synthetase|nr:serine--tRNA ligase [Nitrososphaera sp.]
MLDPKLLKENPGLVRDMLNKRNMSDFPLENLVELDRKRRECIVKTQELRKKKNLLSEAVAAKKKNRLDATPELIEMKEVSSGLGESEQEMVNVEQKFRELLLTVPNLLHDSVPIGKDETQNVLVKQSQNPKNFNFTPKDHVDLATSLDLIDLERAAKISGARFYFLKNSLVMLNQALINFALEFLSGHGYAPVQPPFMIRNEPMSGAVILSDFQDVIYKIEGEDLHMIGTSEHAIVGMHMNEILEGKKLPLKYAGFSSCFRKEAGAHGKDMKGIFRVHQFEKVEQFVYCRPEDSWKEQERMLGLAEEFLQQLGLPYRIMLLSSGDTGKISAKTYDIEAWMAGQNAYREIISCSNCIDYQARRLGIRFRDKTNEDTRLVHTLNSTLVATERTMVGILEYYQTERGTVEIPQVLQKYMGGMKEIKPVN